MSQSLSRITVHLVFSTKNREPLITPEVIGKLHAYMAGTLNGLGCPAIAIGGIADHVHILFVLSKNLALAKVVEELKKASSKWAKTHVSPQFSWQGGYGAFAVSVSNEQNVTDYIRNQEQHHRQRTYQEETRVLMKRHHQELDEKYCWD